MERIQIPTSAMVLVSDGRRARFLRNRGTPVHPELILELALGDDNPPSREQGSDQPGRTHAPDGRSRSALEETDWHRQAEERFASRIADTLYDMEHAHRFRELVMVAPPRMLGELRARLRDEVADTVVAEVPKDLSALSVPELGKHLA
jgi:protein required for attachment to host cells